MEVQRRRRSPSCRDLREEHPRQGLNTGKGSEWGKSLVSAKNRGDCEHAVGRSRRGVGGWSRTWADRLRPAQTWQGVPISQAQSAVTVGFHAGKRRVLRFSKKTALWRRECWVGERAGRHQAIVMGQVKGASGLG